MTRTGELFEISSGNRSAVITEQGSGLFRLRWEGTELLEAVTDDGFGGYGCHGQILLPWPGRVAKGEYEHEGETYLLPIDDHTHGAAIHGWARWATWQVKERAADSLVMAYRMLAVQGYPFSFEFEQRYSWHPGFFEVLLEGTNIGERTAPIGYGAHPYFSLGAKTVDEMELVVPASSYVPVDSKLNPAGSPLPVEGTDFDFREGRRIGSSRLDVTLADVQRDDEGRVNVRLTAPSTGVALKLGYDEPVDYVQVFTGDTLPFARREGLAVEPYTCIPNAFNNKVGLSLVQPGGKFAVRWTVSAGDA